MIQIVYFFIAFVSIPMTPLMKVADVRTFTTGLAAVLLLGDDVLVVRPYPPLSGSLR